GHFPEATPAQHRPTPAPAGPAAELQAEEEMTTPERPDGNGGPDPEEIAMLRRLLDSPAETHQESAIMQALEYAAQPASPAREAAERKPPVGRFQVALQAAVERLAGTGLALAEGQGG